MNRVDTVLNEESPSPRKMLDPYKIPFGWGLVLFVISILIHLAFGVAPLKLARNSEGKKEQFISDVELKYNYTPALDTLQPTAAEKPKDAKFESSRNLKAEEDTSPDSAPSNLAQSKGEKKASTAKSKPQEKGDTGKVLSFSAEEMLKEDHDKLTKFGNGDPRDSTGFLERLKRGNQLKISALESDYAQFIVRMKRKISQRWNPHRTATTRMYDYEVITVDTAMLLDSAGELVDLKIINQSGFTDYDLEGMQAINDAAPFPNPPKSLIQDNGLVYMPFSFNYYIRRSFYSVD